MLLQGLVTQEGDASYRQLAAENLARQFSFLRSAVRASLQLDTPVLSLDLLRALNAHALACLHPCAGHYRTCDVEVGDGFAPPAHAQVPALMEMFAIQTSRLWDSVDAVALAAFVLWRLNNIHPFVEGNGRTARAAAYFVLCVKSGGWLPGAPTLDELIRDRRADYLAALHAVDETAWAGALDVTPLQALLSELAARQLAGLA